MLVIGADLHKETHTCVGVDDRSGLCHPAKTVSSQSDGLAELLCWAQGIDNNRVWALEDCRHVSGGIERFLLAAGERVVRVPPHLTARGRNVGTRQRGKSDEIDALAVARAAISEGVENLPSASVDLQIKEINLFSDHRANLVRSRTQDQNRLKWILHDLFPDFKIPAGALTTTKWMEKTKRKLAKAPLCAAVVVAKDLLGTIKATTKRVDELTAKLAELVKERAPQLLAQHGFGPLTTAVIIGAIEDPRRFETDAKLARVAGTAPIPISSGKTNRHRLDRGGNRELNKAIHTVAMVRGQSHPETQAYLAKKQAEGKTRKESLRCLKRHLTRRIYKDLIRTLKPQIARL